MKFSSNKTIFIEENALIDLKIWSAKCQPFCISLNMLNSCPETWDLILSSDNVLLAGGSWVAKWELRCVNSSSPGAAYVSVNWVSIGSDNGLSPGWHQAIIRTSADILPIRRQGSYFNEILFYPHFNEVEREVYWFHAVRPSVCASVRPPVRLWTESYPLCNFHNTSRIHFIFAHLIKQLQKVYHV